jgi:hypothetical protein
VGDRECRIGAQRLALQVRALGEMRRVARVGGRVIAAEPLEGAIVFSSADEDYCAAAHTFTDTYQQLALRAGMDFNLGARMPVLLSQSARHPLDVTGFVHASWTPLDQRGRATGRGDEASVAWRRKTAQLARLAGESEQAFDLDVFHMTPPDDLLTTFSLVLAVGER